MTKTWSAGAWTFLKRLYKEVFDDDVLGQAAQCAYALIFSLFPFLIFILAVAPFLAPGGELELPGEIARQLPGDVRQIIEARFDEVSGTNDKRGILTVSFLIALWSASAGSAALITAVNRAYDIKEKRPFWKRRLIGAMLMGAGAILVFIPSLYGFLGGVLAAALARTRFDELAVVVAWLRWPVVIAGAVSWLMLLYRVAPEGKGCWRLFSPGVAFSALGLAAATRGVSLYVEHSGGMSVTYGALGGFIILLLWLYVCSVVLLLGAEINAITDCKEQAQADAEARAPAGATEPAKTPALPRPEKKPARRPAPSMIRRVWRKSS